MTEKETTRKKEGNMANLPEDDPLLRSKLSTIDKIIGSEGQQLAEKRIAALKRAHEMPSA